MANALYPLYKQDLLAQSANISMSINDTTNGPYCALVQTSAGGYTYNATDHLWTAVSANAIGPAIGANLSSPTVATQGLFNASGVTYSAVTGNAVGALVIYRHQATLNSSILVLFVDTGVTGLPVTPNGGDITITWNVGGIFQLGQTA